MAYSRKIDDPAFDRFRRNSQNYSFLFSVGLAFLAIAGFYIYGESGSDMENPEALRIGATIGGMFMLIGIFSARSKKVRPSWDGVISDKKIKEVKKDIGDGRNDALRLVYTVFIKGDYGKTAEIRSEDDDTVYNYYNKGDKVRYHGALNSYEKYDKSGDNIIFCNACAFLHDIGEDVCLNCGCPLLK